MQNRGSARASLAIMAAVAGTAFASGRGLALFFCQLGWAGWFGIAFAALAFGLLASLLCRAAVRYGTDSFAALCHRMLGPRAAAAAGWLQSALLLLVALAMLHGAGELGALALPLRRSYLWGGGAALLIALLIILAKLRPLSRMGMLLMTFGLGFYIALALDPRPVRVYLHGTVELALEDSLPAALLLALLYAAMNISVAAGAATRFAGQSRPWRVGLGCGLMLLAMLTCYNLAVFRGGRTLLFQAMPTVILAARWGVVGFWLCAAFGFVCRAATLAAAVSGLIDRLVYTVEK